MMPFSIPSWHILVIDADFSLLYYSHVEKGESSKRSSAVHFDAILVFELGSNLCY